MTQLEFIQVTPQQLREYLADYFSDINRKLDGIKKDFQPKEPTEYLTRKEVQKMLNINMGTLDNWTKHGKLKAYGLGARIYYKRHEVDNALIRIKEA